MTVLYITQNGITDHIGRSQVAPYVIGLAQQGFKVHVLSAEKTGREQLIAQYQNLFDQAGVKWTRVGYHNRPAILGQIWTQAMMQRAAQKIVKREGIRLLHCRSHPTALIGDWLKSRYGIKFIFDFRDFYADGGLAKESGIRRLIFKGIKKREAHLIRSADKVVCLTNSARHLLSKWYLKDVSNVEQRFQVIPCCADFSHFDPVRVSEVELARARTKAELTGNSFVLLYLGSLGPDYLLAQMVALFRQLLLIQANAYFLFVTNGGRDLVEMECAQQGVPANRICFVSADRSEVPAFINLAQLSVLFIRADISKAGCSPTKLAELFACNIPVITNSGVGDLDSIIDPQRNGSVIVKNFSDDALRAALDQIVEMKAAAKLNIRENSREFALEEGVALYASVYKELLAA